MIRFVLDPARVVTPDVEEKLPGRGAWLSAERKVFEGLGRRNPFPRAFREEAKLPEDLAGLTERLLRRRCLDLLGLANGAGLVTAGFEKVADKAGKGEAAVMIVAADGGGTARERAARLAGPAPLVGLFGREELSLALGRGNVVHAAVASGRLADMFLRETERLSLISGSPVDW
ncbi:MAG: hypothetical protein TEF_06045 [Rhizobiales bacterium NRL2]|nr:MAG: hypothetical protein TEF_06045 [Rhizobiales bacterium NRL2]